MTYVREEVELTRELVDAYSLPTPPQEFKASLLYRGHSWDDTTEGYELMRRVEYYSNTPAHVFVPAPNEACGQDVSEYVPHVYPDHNNAVQLSGMAQFIMYHKASWVDKILDQMIEDLTTNEHVEGL